MALRGIRDDHRAAAAVRRGARLARPRLRARFHGRRAGGGGGPDAIRHRRAARCASRVRGAGGHGAADRGRPRRDGPRAFGRRGDAATPAYVQSAFGAGAAIRSAEAVGPKVSGELLRSGVLASLATASAIAVYVWLRFEAQFGIAAFLTTLHDVLLMVGLYAVTGMTFDLTSVAALLMVAGYSINDTVVVFDRIRETLGRDRAAPLPDVIDRAITDTLRRTLMTSVTTLAASVALMTLGGPVLFGFAAAVTFGVAIGTWSSIFVAAPLLLNLPGRLPGREPADKSFAAKGAP